MAISAVGSVFITNASHNVIVSPTALGNILVLGGRDINTEHILTVSGGGVTTWVKLQQNDSTNSGSVDLWYGVITSTGPSTITITNGGATYTSTALWCLEFSGGGVGTWSVDTGGSQNTGTLAASGNYPSLTPAGFHELFVGCGNMQTTITGGSDAGYTYFNPVGATGNEVHGQFVYNLNCSSPTAYAPSWSQTSSSHWAIVDELLIFTPSLAPTSGFFEVLGL